MAINSNLTYTIQVDADNATATVRSLNGQIVKTAIPVSSLNKEFKSITASLKENVNAVGLNIQAHKNSELAISNEINKLTSLRSALDVSSKEYEQLGSRISLLNQKLNTVKSGASSAVGGLDQMKTASGGATSAVLELGRVVQDAPYGIRGMANNITQLASQMAYATKTAGSFKGALKDMGKAMMGPLGIVFAISIVVSLLDGLYGGMKKTEKQVDSFNDSLVENSMKVEKMRALKGIVEDNTTSLENQKDALEELKKLGFDPAKKSLDEFIESQAKLAVVNASIKAIEDTLSDVMKERLELNIRAKKELSDYYEMLESGAVGIDIQGAILDKLKIDKEELDKKEKELKIQFQNLVSRALDLTDTKTTDKDKKNRAKSILLPKLTDLRDIVKVFAKEWGIAWKDVPLKVETELDLSFFQTEESKRNADEKIQEIFNQRLEGLKEYARLAKEVLSSITDFIDSEFERELTIEQNKTTALNNELNQRLLNENLSKSERAKIQNEIAKNDEALRKKQEVIEKKRFEMNKAANIAGATIDTFRAAAGVLADTKGGSFARIAGMIAVIGAGLAQVTAISRQQFVSSAGSNTPIRGLGSSGGEADRSFNFNLVGNNQANQIAEALQGQFSNPLKAYVVSREVTTQQELDMNIKSGASF
jgi:hypothetical protein